MPDKQLNIIIIDDDALSVFTIERLIKKSSPSTVVQSFLSGEKALAHFSALDRGSFPNVILLDLYMPVMDGWQFLEAYQAKGFENKFSTIYILSSSIDERDATLAEEHGLIQEFLKKPLQKEKLASLLAHHLAIIR